MSQIIKSPLRFQVGDTMDVRWDKVPVPVPQKERPLNVKPPVFQRGEVYTSSERGPIQSGYSNVQPCDLLGAIENVVCPLPNEMLWQLQQPQNGGDFSFHGNCIFVHLNRKTVRLTNFVVWLVAKIKKISLTAEQDFLLIILQSNRGKQQLEIAASAYQELDKYIARKASAFRLYPDSGKPIAFFRVYLSQLFENYGHVLEERQVYTYPGWQRLADGRWHYFSGLDAGCESTMALVDLSRVPQEEQNAADAFVLHLLRIGELMTLLPILLHLHGAFMARIFAEARLPMRFILDVQGPTGVSKTYAMTLFACPFDARKRMANFLGTGKGFERFAEEHHDGLVVLDDLSCANDKAGKALLERVIREVCNGTGRLVSTHGGKNYEMADVSYAVIMTSEACPDDIRQSSQLRIFRVPMSSNSLPYPFPPDIADAILRPQPGHISPIDIHLTRFIRWLEPCFDYLVDFVRGFNPPPYRGKYRRHDVVYRILSTEAAVLLKYFTENGVLDATSAAQIYQHDWIPVLQELMRFNELLGTINDPVRVFLDLLVPGIVQSLIPVAQTRQVFEMNPSAFFGFWDPSRDTMKLVLDPHRLYQWTKKHFTSMHRDFPVTLAELLQKLVSQGLSEGYARKGRAKPKPLKAFKINGKLVSLLVLHWEDIQSYMDNNDQEG